MAEKTLTLREQKNLNDQDRMWFVNYWAQYVRTHPDEVWSKQQNVLINSQMHAAKFMKLSPKDYLDIKNEKCLRK